MYRILLADDEGIVIDSLKFIIGKEFGQECLVESAKTGRGVIELAEQFRPDITIMDIQMPGINGIEAMKEIRKNNKNVIFIVMSAYDKFDYAKEAIKVGGVLEYITKPMERRKIVSILSRAMELVDKDRERRSNDLMLKEKLEIVVPIIENGFIYNILFQEYFIEDIEYYKKFLGITSDFGYMITVVCGDKQEGNHMTNAVGSSIRMQSHYQEIRECIKDYFDGVIGTVMGNKIAVLMPCDKEQIEYSERIELIEKARELVRKMRRKTGIGFRIGIGSTRLLQDMADSYHEALNALVYSTGSVAHVDDLPLRCGYEEDYPVHMEKKLFDQVEKGQINDAMQSAAEFFDWMASQYPDSIMDIRLKVLEFVLWAEHLAYDKGGMVYQFKDREDYLPSILRMEELIVLRSWFVEKIEIACRNVVSKRSEKSDSLVEIAKDYIDCNYDKDLSLDDVSRRVDISPYYFSKIFKEGTGKNFVEYLTLVRIEKAKELLVNTEHSMKEICIMVGYSEPNYFSRSFKKNVGVTPTEYKEGKRYVV